MKASIINKKRVELSFQRSLDTYNENAKVQEIICSKLLNAVQEHCGNTFDQILEIGAGTGLLTEKIINQFVFKHICLNDLVNDAQTPLLRVCNTRKDIGIQFQMGDAEKLQFSPHNNLIISASTVQWFENLPLFFENAKNNLDTNGILAFSTFGTTNLHEIRSIENRSLPYFHINDLRKMLANHFEILWMFEEQIPAFFTTPKDILQHIKYTGVNGIESTRWTKKDLLRFTSEFEKFYSDNLGYSLTYHPVYVIGKKIKDDHN